MVCVCMRVFDVLTVHPLMNFIREPVCRWTFFTCIFKTCRGFTEWHHTFLGTIWDHTSVTFLNICLINLKSFLIWTVISNNFITPRLPPGCTTSIPESDRECYMWIKVEVTAPTSHHSLLSNRVWPSPWECPAGDQSFSRCLFFSPENIQMTTYSYLLLLFSGICY